MPNDNPLNRQIDASVSCGKCGTRGIGKCDCYRKCPCGWLVERGKDCNSIAHSVGARLLFREGYWVILDSGKPFKTRTQSLEWLRKSLESGRVYLSRKDAKAGKSWGSDVKR